MAPCAPNALLEMKLETRSRRDADGLLWVLAGIAAAEPAFSFYTNPESGELIIGGMSELQLDSIIERLKSEHGLEVACGAPQVSYRETVRSSRQVTYHHNQVGGQQRENAVVQLKVEPTWGAGTSYRSELGAEDLPPVFAEAIASAVTQVFSDGLLLGFRMTDLSVTLCHAEWNNDSSPAAFKIATRRAMREACEKAGIVLLEPIMAVEVSGCPASSLQAVMTDLDGRRAQIRDQVLGAEIIIRAWVPLGNLFGFPNDLNRLTNGAARSAWGFSHCAEVPRSPSGPDDFPPAVGMRA